MKDVALPPWFPQGIPVDDPRLVCQLIRDTNNDGIDAATVVVALLKSRFFAFPINAPVASHGTLLEVLIHYAEPTKWRESVADFVRFFVGCGGNVNACLNEHRRPPPLEAACRRCNKCVEHIVGLDERPHPSSEEPYLCQLIKALIEHGATLTDKALGDCIRYDHPECTKRIIRAGLKFGPVTGLGSTHWFYQLTADVVNTAKGVVALLGFRKFHRSPMLASSQKDVILLIAKMVWHRRFDTETWQRYY